MGGKKPPGPLERCHGLGTGREHGDGVDRSVRGKGRAVTPWQEPD